MDIRDYIAPPTRIAKSAAPAQAEAMDEIAAQTGYVLGPVLRWLLSQENGGRARAGLLELPDRSNTVINDVLSAEQIVEAWRGLSAQFMHQGPSRTGPD